MNTYSEILYVVTSKTLIEVSFSIKKGMSRDTYTAKVFRLGSFVCEHPSRYDKEMFSHKSIGEFDICVDHANTTLRFGPSHALGMLPEKMQGYGIGRYCMVNLLNLIDPKFHGYSIQDGMLSTSDARDLRAKENRNIFYRQMGFTLSLDATERDGSFSCNSIAHLATTWNRDKIRKVSSQEMNQYLENYYQLKAKFHSEKDKGDRYRNDIEYLQKTVGTKTMTIWTMVGVWMLTLYVFAKVIL
jgi:hypothetical protein